MAAATLLADVRGERIPTPVNPEMYDLRGCAPAFRHNRT